MVSSNFSWLQMQMASVPGSTPAAAALDATAVAGTWSRAEPEVTQAIADASRSTGVDFNYLMNKAQQESGFDPDAKARTSSATGLYQFIDRTWLDMVDKHGPRYGLSKEADAIQRRSDGSPVVSDGAMRRKILELRNDPKISAAMAAEYASDNQAYLEQRLGRKVGSTELYLAHFLGAGGAGDFLRAMDRKPGATAAAVVPSAAASNRSIFYDKKGHARSLESVYERFAAKFDNGSGGGNGGVDPSVAARAQLASASAPAPASGGQQLPPGSNAGFAVAWLAAMPHAEVDERTGFGHRIGDAAAKAA